MHETATSVNFMRVITCTLYALSTNTTQDYMHIILGIPIDGVPTSKKMRILHLRVCQVPSQFKDDLVEKVS